MFARQVENSFPAEDKDEIRRSTKLLEKLKFSEQERGDYGIVEKDGMIFWAPDSESKEKEIEFEDEEFKQFMKSRKAFKKGPKDPKILAFLDKVDDIESNSKKE